MVQTLKSALESIEANDARRAAEGHDGLRPVDIEAIAAMRAFTRRLLLGEIPQCPFHARQRGVGDP